MKTKRTTGLLVLLAFALLSAACTNPTAQADAAISSVNGHLKAAASSEAKVKDLTAQVGAVPYTKAGALQALDIIAQMQSELNTQRTELSAAQRTLRSALALKIKPELKTYIGLEATAIGTRIKLVDAGLVLYGETGRMYRAIRDGRATNVAINNLTAEMDATTSQIETLTQQAATQTQAASDYFTAHKLGGK